MTPKEKALQLVTAIVSKTTIHGDPIQIHILSTEEAKTAAIACVNSIENMICDEFFEYWGERDYLLKTGQYWKQVKTEIKKL